MLTVYAPAKVNLVLEVLGKCGDYHRISSILQTIDLCDVLNFELAEEVSFRCSEPGLESDNLAMKAAMLVKEATKCGKGARIELRKHIPWGTGLGGGSSDAAATLLALNQLWKLKLSTSDLLRLASELGSDVPFFIYGGTGLIEGKGERVTSLPLLNSTRFVLLVPPLGETRDKTRQLYGKLSADCFTGGQYVHAALSSLRQDRTVLPSMMFNAFERVAFDFFPGLSELRRGFREAGAPSVHLAGSGPCLLAPVPEKDLADELRLRLENQGLNCYLASSSTPAWYQGQT